MQILLFLTKSDKQKKIYNLFVKIQREFGCIFGGSYGKTSIKISYILYAKQLKAPPTS